MNYAGFPLAPCPLFRPDGVTATLDGEADKFKAGSPRGLIPRGCRLDAARIATGIYKPFAGHCYRPGKTFLRRLRIEVRLKDSSRKKSTVDLCQTEVMHGYINIMQLLT
jgi:hypothetical protein